jgi:iron complex outermembrane receptor protein
VGAGLAWIDANGSNIGVSLARHDSLYGIPNRLQITTSVEGVAPEGDVRIDMRQWRTDFRAEIVAGGPWIDRLKLRAGYADYEHAELEPSGEIGTQFFNKGMEVRFDTVQSTRGGWSGSSGAQFFSRQFEAVGAEKFLPPSQTDQFSLFTLQQFDFGRLKAEGGVRLERNVARASADNDLATSALSRRFTSYSGSIGALYEVITDWRFGVSLTHAERAPNAEELFSNGPHAGTLAFERGNPNLAKERSNGAELTLRGRMAGLTVDVSAYYNRYENFVYQAPTGENIDSLPAYQMLQGRAVHKGFEVELKQQLGVLRGFALSTDVMADYVRATVAHYGPAPQIPPLRVLGGVEARSDLVDLRVEVEHVTAANRLAPVETATADFTLVNLSSTWRPWGEDAPLSLRLSVNNLFDVTARRHSSLLKDDAPMAGRDVRLGAAVRF